MRESAENYLETIYILSQKKKGVHALDVAKELNFSKPSITRALGLLKTAGHIIVDDDKHIQLTTQGLKKAKEIFERHQIITQFWIKHGVSEKVASSDACRMEHDISQETFEKIKEFVGE